MFFTNLWKAGMRVAPPTSSTWDHMLHVSITMAGQVVCQMPQLTADRHRRWSGAWRASFGLSEGTWVIGARQQQCPSPCCPSGLLQSAAPPAQCPGQRPPGNTIPWSGFATLSGALYVQDYCRRMLFKLCQGKDDVQGLLIKVLQEHTPQLSSSTAQRAPCHAHTNTQL